MADYIRFRKFQKIFFIVSMIFNTGFESYNKENF